MDVAEIKKEEIKKVCVENFKNNFLYPKSIYIQPTNQCNLRCKMCAVYGRPGYKEEKAQFIDFALYKKVIDEIKDKDITIAPTGGGEVFLSPDIFRMIRYAKDSGVKTTFIDTNGVLLDKDIIDKAVEIGIDIISVSIDAFSPESYSQVRRNENYHKIVDNVNYMIKKKEKNKNLNIYVSFVCQETNCHEKEKFIRHWLGRVDQVIVNNRHNLDNGLVEELNYEPAPHLCGYPYLAMHILVDGSVTPCSHFSLDKKHVIGSIKDDTVYDIWNGNKYNEFRSSLIKKFTDEGRQCDMCNQWMSFSHRLINKGPIIINETPTTTVYSMPDKSIKNRIFLKFVKL